MPECGACQRVETARSSNKPRRRVFLGAPRYAVASTRPTAAQQERTMISVPPVIVLVRPQLGQNIGKAARAMLNFGLTEMRLIAPRDGWPNPDAGPSAAGADIILERADRKSTRLNSSH